MRVLVACEFSGVVRDAFRKRGHDAVSCDLLPSERSGPHIQDDVLNHLEGWDLIIAHPPCTHLSKAGAAHWKRKPAHLQVEAIAFVLKLMRAPAQRIAVENPVGKLNTAVRKPDQIIHPYQFGEPWMKETCLWLKGLPLLLATAMIEPKGNWVRPGNIRNRRFNRQPEGAKCDVKERSRTFQGIADAMAEQWGSR